LWSKPISSIERSELLRNLEKGTVRAAVDDVEIARYSTPTLANATTPRNASFRAWRDVPPRFGCVRYKAIYLEENPKEDGLLTVRQSQREF